MPETVRPILLTPDIERLRAFSLALLDATVEERLPEDGPAFYLEPWVGDSTVGLTADADVVAGTPGRILLSIGVPDVDALLPGPRASVATPPGRRRTCRGAAGRAHLRPGRQRGAPHPAAVTGSAGSSRSSRVAAVEDIHSEEDE